MDIFIKEALYVLDYDNNIVDMIFTSDDHRTPGYAYNINVEESNMGYSNLTFTMPTQVMGMPNEWDEAPAEETLIPNPKLDLLTPLVKLRYNRQIIYTGDTPVVVQIPEGYGDTTAFIDKEYQPGDVVENYIMDYIVQPLDKKRSSYEVSVNFTAIDYPRFNLSKKKMGLTINENTITRDEWTMFKSEPISVAGTVQYIKWNDTLGRKYAESGNTIPNEWDPTTERFPLTEKEISNLLGTSEFEKDWAYGISATVYWWPITKTGRLNGTIYNQGDYLTLQFYPKFETGNIEVSEIRHTLDFYGYQWLFLDKGDSYLTPNNPCNYLNWVLENTNWSIARKDVPMIGWTVSAYTQNEEFILNDLPHVETGNYWMYKCVNHEDINYLYYQQDSHIHEGIENLPTLSTEDAGKWICAIVKDENGLEYINAYTWDGMKWYLNYADREYILTYIYEWDGKEWHNISDDYKTANIDKRTGIVYDVDIVETEVAKPEQAAGDLFETTALVTALSASESNCYNAITEIAKTFQLYPHFDCEARTVSLRIFAGKNYGLTYMLGRSLENTATKADGDKVITKLYAFGGQDTNGEEAINLGDAERSYRESDDNPDEREPWDPNAPEYIQKRSPYGTNYIYNFKWMYDNGWMSKDDILGIYALNQQIQDLNKSFLEPYTKDFLTTNDEYVNAGVVYSTNQDEYLSVITSMMNTYYREPGKTTDKFTAFPVAPGDCKLEPGTHRYYLEVQHCYKCGATAPHFENNTCPNPECSGDVHTKKLHVNTWEEEHFSALSTTSDQWDPSSKGHFQQVLEQLGEGSEKFINIGTIFTEIPMTDFDTNEKAFEINKETVYDKSGHLYNWNDSINKWLKFYGLALDANELVNELQKRVEKLEQAYKVYEYEKGRLENEIQDAYGNFIIEGKFQDEQIVYSAILLVKALEASEQYATPEITYNLSVVDSSGLIEYRAPGSEVYNDLVHSLHNVGQIVPKAGDYVTIYDEPMGLYGVPGLITTIKRVLDNPQSNSITVDTSYTDDEELVGNIITATNTVLNNSDIYARTAILKTNGTIDGAALTKTLENNSGNDISFVGVNGSTLLDSKGLLVTNQSDPSRKMKYSGAGVFGTVDNGITYEPLLTPTGINANYISSGSIDTHKIQIMSGLHSKVVLDSQGLSIKTDHAKPYQLPSANDIQNIDGTTFPDWSKSNLQAFLGVDYNNEARLYLKGQMQIEGGSTIAGWRVTENRLSSGSSNKYIGLSSSGDYAFWAGAEKPEDAGVAIKADGTGVFRGDLYASSLTLDPNIKIDYQNNIANTPNIDNIVDDAIEYCIFQDGTIGSLDSSVDTTQTAGGFKVSKDGLLQASNAVIQGTIYAQSGTFTGDIVANSLTLGTGVKIDYSKIDNAPDAPDLTYYIKQDGTISGTESGTARSFTVSKQGLLTATNAVITGQITASSGQIGNWSLNSTVHEADVNKYLYGIVAEGNAIVQVSSGGKYAGIKSTPGSAFYAGASSPANGGGACAFSVSHSGQLKASDVEITGGTITLNNVRFRSAGFTAGGTKYTGVCVGPFFISNTMGGIVYTTSEGTKLKRMWGPYIDNYYLIDYYPSDQKASSTPTSG